MGRIRRSFDVQFKIRICEAIESGTKRIPELCREYQIQRTVIEGWLKRYIRGELAAKTGDRQGELERENEKLKSKVGELIMQIDAIKKAHDQARQAKNESGWRVSGGSLDRSDRPAKTLALLPAPSTTSKKDRH
jgi:transposase-like protein